MQKLSFLFLLFCSSLVFSQKNTATLFTVDKQPVLVSEFKKMYEQNSETLIENKEKDVKNYIDLFINFKLKLKAASALQLDTTTAFKREMTLYKNQLMGVYLQDTIFQKKLLRQMYYRTKYAARASHILIKLAPNALPKDSLQAYQKIMQARKELLAGKPFAVVAKKYSEDPSVKQNGGDVGYFTAFKMVYPFENKAYQTKVGEISLPFRTRFGYHLVKTTDLKKAGGTLQVAHILIADTSKKGKIKIDSLYNLLKKGANFAALAKQFSNDLGSKNKGGKLPVFGLGRMIAPFEKAAFSLKKTNEISQPFKTQFGWHIVKLLKKQPLQSFEQLKGELAERIKASGRNQLADKALLNRLKKRYTITVNKSAKPVFSKARIFAIPEDSLQGVLIRINKKNINQLAFRDYIRNRRNKPIPVLFEGFLNSKIKQYFKDHLATTNLAYAATVKEYKEGLLIFDIMQQKIWNKSTKDSVGLQHYFEKHKNNYIFKDLAKHRGKVMSDYQTFLEQQWIAELKTKYRVKIKNSTLKKLLQYYKTK